MHVKAPGIAACMLRWKYKSRASLNLTKPKKAIRQRTCIGCRKVDDKHEMLRVFKGNDGKVSVDLKGNRAGRGAYICSPECLKIALDRNLIGRALRIKFANEFEDDEKEAIGNFFSSSKKKSCKE